jgi:GTPase-associated protein 1, N-terminal domain type 2/GTPase-associated protein 1, C-terminal domain/GTPase-associated protein 1, middle domain
VAFQQLYYTSCETGLAGYGGYQFNAVTPGTSPVVMREIEDRSVYEPPGYLVVNPVPDEPEAYPIALSYFRGEAQGEAILTHVMFAGTDYSGRPGNYFVHALVTSTPEQDFGPLLPAELWGAELWQRTPIETTKLPELPGPLPRGVVDRPGVQAFLDARGTEALLPELLTAVWSAMAGDRLVLLASHDANENIWWIAALEYLLGQHLAARMTFTTYSHRLGYSRHHVTGIQSDTVPADAGSAFQLFDLDAARTPGGDVHPLAALLVGTGVMATDGLWRQAAAFTSGTEQAPDDWHGPVAAAAGLLSGRLSPRDTDAVVRWLPGAAGRIPTQHLGVVLGMVLAQPDARLADEQLIGLRDLAHRLPAPVQEEQLERLLIQRAVTRISGGEQAGPVRFGPRTAEGARAEVSGLLRTASPAVVLSALQWAAASNVMPGDAELEWYGQVLTAPEPELSRLLRLHPAVLRGFVARLAGEPAELAAEVLAGPAGAHLHDADLAPYPDLAAERLVILAGQGRVTPQRAYDQIVDIRIAAQRSPYVDATLLGRLWPAGCPPEQITDLLGAMAELNDPDVRDWFVAQIQAAADLGTRSKAWLQLALALTSHSLLPLLPEELARVVQGTVSVETKRRRARQAVDRGELGIFRELYADHRATEASARTSSARDLARLLARAEPLAEALRGCPPDVVPVFCEGLQAWLDPSRPDPRLAARIFTALADPELQAQTELVDQLTAAVEPVHDWHRRELAFVKHLLSGDPAAERQLNKWREGHRGGLARKLLGGRPGLAEGR